jgi:hypothetical protein
MSESRRGHRLRYCNEMLGPSGFSAAALKNMTKYETALRILR